MMVMIDEDCATQTATQMRASHQQRRKATSGAVREQRVRDHERSQSILGSVRKLWPTETEKFRDHLLRLDKESRRLRFAHSVSDSFIEDYASRMTEFGSVVYGHIVDGHVRGAAELRRLGDSWGQEAEAAFSVEKPFRIRASAPS